MRNIIIWTALLVSGCATDLSGTGKIVTDSICEWELHGGGVTPDTNFMFCWAEHRFRRDDQWIYLNMPVDCEIAYACMQYLDPPTDKREQR